MEPPTQTEPADQPDPADKPDPADQTEVADAPAATPTRGRRILVNALIAFTTLLLVVGIFSIWANRLLFNPDNWSNTSTQLLQNADIRSTTANYLVDQLYANVNVTGLISSGLPPRLAPLAAPAAGALRNVAVKGVDLALTRPRVQNLWALANRAADQTFVTIVGGGTNRVKVNGGAVTLNLGLILGNVASRLGLPSDLSSKLPPSIANLTVFKSDQLSLVQDAGNAIKNLALWLTILVPLLYLAAIALAGGRRRRTLMSVGFGGVIAGVIALLGRSLLLSQGTGALTHDASLKPTVRAVFSISTGMITEIAGACILIGFALVAAAWFAGPSRFARPMRETIAPFLRERPVETYGIVLALVVLVFIIDPIPATGKPDGMLVFLALAMVGTYLLREQTEQEFPEAQAGTATARIRARVSAIRDSRERSKTASGSGASAMTMPDQLRQLAELRDHGAITPEEYQAAKAQLLRT